MRGTDHKQSPLFSYINLEDRIPRDLKIFHGELWTPREFRSTHD